MTVRAVIHRRDSVSLQAAVSAASRVDGSEPAPHHPIVCKDEPLCLFEDGRLACRHTEVAPDDLRTKFCVDHSIAILLMEVAYERFGT